MCLNIGQESDIDGTMVIEGRMRKQNKRRSNNRSLILLSKRSRIPKKIFTPVLHVKNKKNKVLKKNSGKLKMKLTDPQKSIPNEVRNSKFIY